MTNETHKQMGALLQLYFASEEKKKKDYLLSQKQKEKLKPIHKLQKGSEKNKVNNQTQTNYISTMVNSDICTFSYSFYAIFAIRHSDAKAI